MSEVRGGGREETPRVRGQGRRPGGAILRPRSGRRPRGDTPRPRSGRPREVTSRPRPGAVTLRSHPELEARGGSWEEPPMPNARASSQEEQPKEWWLCRHRRA